MASLTKSVNVEFPLGPKELAAYFCEMDGHEQAEFFNHIAEISMEWDRPFCFQLQGIIDSPKLNGGGITIMREIGEYGEGKLQDLRQITQPAEPEERRAE